MMRITLLISIVTALLAVSAVACSSDESDKSDSAAAVPTVPTSTTDPECGAVPPDLAGTYTTETKADELPPEVADMQVGTFELRLGPGHRVITVAPHGNEIDGSPACVRGVQIAVAEEPAGGACSGLGPGMYEWALRGDELVLTKVEERCVYRAYTMTARPWRRKAAG
jgi:hypothetical protein